MKYPTEVLLSITTGVLMCDFSKMHECIEFLCGVPVFTHQLAYEPFVSELRSAVLSQQPQLKAADASGVGRGNWEVFRDEQIKAFGAALDIEPMATYMTTRKAAFTEPLKGLDVIQVALEEPV